MMMMMVMMMMIIIIILIIVINAIAGGFDWNTCSMFGSTKVWTDVKHIPQYPG
jgi:hypothetical protein